MSPLELELLPATLAVARLAPGSPIPAWASAGSFCSITRTAEEISIVAEDSLVPADARAERGWRAMRVRGRLDFALTGVLASLTAPLAERKISLFSISTFDTDYLLVRRERFFDALAALFEAGHRIIPLPVFPAGYVQPPLRTARLRLEPIDESHAQALQEIYLDRSLHAHVPHNPLITLEQRVARCRRWATRLSLSGEQRLLNWLMVTEGGQVVGHVQATVGADQRAEIGYVVKREFHRQGFATEALTKMLDYLRDALGVKEARAESHVDNEASHKVARKLGMAQTGRIPGATVIDGVAYDDLVFTKQLG